MTATGMLDLKQKLSKLSAAQRREISLFLLRLNHESASWKRELGQRVKQMDQGKKVRLRDLAKDLGYAKAV